MNQTDFSSLVNRVQRSTSDLLVSKGAEYASDTDRLANFKKGAKLTGCTPLQVAFVYLSKHYDALANYIKRDATGQQIPLSEPITGRLEDLINYCFLTYALIDESKLNQKTSRMSDLAKLLGEE